MLKTAVELAEHAGKIIQSYQAGPISTEKKADKTTVTQADLDSDKIIRQGLQKAFPEHGILTEEYGVLGKQNSDYFWLVDPLDGTKAFAKQIPGYCVMIGLLYQGQPYLGVVVDPREGRRYEAIRGGGAFQVYQENRTQVHVSSRHQYPEMPLIISTGFPEKKLERTLQQLKSPLVDPINSVGIKVGLMVRQVGDIYLNHHGVHYWDTCAPQVILEEAGGTFTLLDGTPLSYPMGKSARHSGPTLASNGTRHKDLVRLFKQIGLD